MTNRMKALAEAKVAASLIEEYRSMLDEGDKIDLIEGQTGVLEMIDALIYDMTVDRAHIAGIDDVIDMLSERRVRLEVRHAKRRDLLLRIMQIIEMRSLERPMATVSVRSSPPRVLILDEEALPTDMLRVKATPDKAKIGEHLKAGGSVPGAVLTNREDYVQLKFS